MNLNDIIIYIMAVFAAAGVIDHMLGNKIGLGAKFEEGLLTIGTLTMAMVGILVLAPALAELLIPVVAPVAERLRFDPAIAAGMLLANDMGGAVLAEEMALTKEAADFAGLVVGSMLGVTIVFTIPVSFGIVHKDDHAALAKGVLAGITTVPVGCIVGGITAGYEMGMILKNLTPILILVFLIIWGLLKKPDWMVKGFSLFGKGITLLITFGLGVGIVQALTGIVLIKKAAPIRECFGVVGDIVIVLAGAFPLVFVITKLCRKPLQKFGSWLGMNETASAGMVVTLANSVPMFGMVKDMDERGKVINMAFAVSSAFVFGDHLGFTAGVNPEMIVPVIAGKLAGGISAIGVAVLLTYRKKHKKEAES